MVRISSHLCWCRILALLITWTLLSVSSNWLPWWRTVPAILGLFTKEFNPTLTYWGRDKWPSLSRRKGKCHRVNHLLSNFIFSPAPWKVGSMFYIFPSALKKLGLYCGVYPSHSHEKISGLESAHHLHIRSKPTLRIRRTYPWTGLSRFDVFAANWTVVMSVYVRDKLRMTHGPGRYKTHITAYPRFNLFVMVET